MSVPEGWIKRAGRERGEQCESISQGMKKEGVILSQQALVQPGQGQEKQCGGLGHCPPSERAHFCEVLTVKQFVPA